MADKNKTYRIFISVAEPSADAHCAGLITAMRKIGYDNIDFVGVGGPKMAEAGCKLLQITIGKAVMMYKAFSQVGHYYKLIKSIIRYLKTNKVDLVIVCDSPSFNFHIAKAAKKLGIKTLFYVAPQLWAWAPWRIKKLHKYCDKLCCILPFEQDWFSQRGIDVVFVGNPLLDDLGSGLPGEAIAKSGLASFKKEYANFKPQNARFAIMPGSRAAEIESLWRPMQQIAVRLKQKYPDAKFTTVAVDAERQQVLKAAQIPGFECRYAISSVSETAADVDFSIVASGSATLQVAAVGCPMVIMYQSSRILWHLAGRWLVKTKYLSLVNILAGKELVPEFMPYFSSLDPIVESIEQLLENTDMLAQVSGELIRLVKPLSAFSETSPLGGAEKKACERVAEITAQMLA
jgi:lipid-A-disaccharide synthase